MTVRGRAALAAGTSALALGFLSGCGGSGSNAAPATSPTLSAAATALKTLATASRDSNFSSRYLARANNGRTAVVRVYYRDASTYRIDVVEAGVTAQQFGTSKGTVACTIAPKVKPACYLVAKPGAAIPSQFNAGVQRVLSIDLPLLAKSTASFGVVERPALPAAGKLPAARCFAVTHDSAKAPVTAGLADDVDAGTYCLAKSGPPRRLTFASGSLTLQSVGPGPTAKQLALPAAVVALPASAVPRSTSRATPPISGLPTP